MFIETRKHVKQRDYLLTSNLSCVKENTAVAARIKWHYEVDRGDT